MLKQHENIPGAVCSSPAFVGSPVIKLYWNQLKSFLWYPRQMAWVLYFGKDI